MSKFFRLSFIALFSLSLFGCSTTGSGVKAETAELKNLSREERISRKKERIARWKKLKLQQKEAELAALVKYDSQLKLTADEQYERGLSYCTGGNDLPLSSERAVYWFIKSIDNGKDDAQYYLANIYHHGGNGVARDYGQAIYWYNKSQAIRLYKEIARSYTYVKLGAIYELGDGVVQDKGGSKILV